MGKFTDWMMKGMDDGDDDFDSNRRGQNNFDKYARDNHYREDNSYRDDSYREERSYREDRAYREERPYREERSYAQERPQYREETPAYTQERVDYNRVQSEQPAQPTSTLPLVGGEGGKIQNVVLYSPKSFSDVQTLIDFLKAREPSVIDLAGVGDSSAQRILDFLSGAIYALEGNIHRISGSIFLLTPSGVTITVPNDVRRKLEGR